MFSKELLKELVIPESIKPYIKFILPYGLVRFDEKVFDSIYLSVYIYPSILEKLNIAGTQDEISGVLKFQFKNKYTFNSFYILVNDDEYRFDKNFSLLYKYKTLSTSSDKIIMHKKQGEFEVEKYFGSTVKKKFDYFSQYMKKNEIIINDTPKFFRWGYKNDEKSIYLFIDKPDITPKRFNKLF